MPDKLPRGWVTTTLGEIRSDRGRGISQNEMTGGTFALYSVPAYSDGEPEIITGEEIGSNKVVVTPGDVLICKINPRINRAWVVGESKGYRQIASTEWIVFSKQEGIVSDFLRLYFTQDVFRNYLAANVSGVGGSLMRVRPTVVEKYPIKLPPTREQQRIVAKLNVLLSRVAAGEAASRRALGRLQCYRISILHDAVTGELTRNQRRNHQAEENGVHLLKRIFAERRASWEKARLGQYHAVAKPTKATDKKRYPEPVKVDTKDLPPLPRGWTWATLDQIAQEGRPILYGIIKPGPHDPNGVPYVRVMEMKEGKIDVNSLKKASPARAAKFARATLAAGDILISKDGTIGKVAVVPPELAGGNITQHVIRAPIHALMCRDYVVVAIKSDWCQNWLTGETRGIALQGVNVADFRRLPIPVPPLDEQKEIANEVNRRLSSADRLTATLNQQLDRAEATRQSLLRDAFAGKLLPQELKDEPASALLDRIRSDREAESKKPQAKRMPKSKAPPARRPLLDVLREHKKPITPEQLFRQAGFQPAEVALFYHELASLRKVIREKKPSGIVARSWPLRTKVTLELTED